MRVALYVRRSTIDLQPDSLEAQEERLRSHAAASGYEVVRAYSDSASGKRVEKRDAFQRLIEDVKRRPDFEAILVRDVSRWSRAENTDEAGYYEFICHSHGVRVDAAGNPLGAVEHGDHEALSRCRRRRWVDRYEDRNVDHP
jgi:DNA invertase Pin-like site-specific DNA recombinase